MPWVVDGNNVARGADRSTVRSAVLNFARKEKLRVVLFFDGAPPPGSSQTEQLGVVEVRYVFNADGAIIEVVRQNGRQWRLVTDDRGLAARAREFGVSIVSCVDFLARAQGEPLSTWLPAKDEGGPSNGLPFVDGATFRLPDAPARIVRKRSKFKRTS